MEDEMTRTRPWPSHNLLVNVWDENTFLILINKDTISSEIAAQDPLLARVNPCRVSMRPVLPVFYRSSTLLLNRHPLVKPTYL